MSGVLVRRYDPPAVDEREILRYAGVRGEAPELLPILRDCLSSMWDRLTYRVAFCEVPVSELPVKESRSLDHRLAGCERAVIFGATVGLEPDRRLLRWGSREPTHALLCQAIGTERVEALCEGFCQELAEEYGERGMTLRPRFSPGYGDCPLSVQRDIVARLDTPRRIGLTLNESLLLSPTKSVTAIVGLELNRKNELNVN